MHTRILLPSLQLALAFTAVCSTKCILAALYHLKELLLYCTVTNRNGYFFGKILMPSLHESLYYYCGSTVNLPCIPGKIQVRREVNWSYKCVEHKCLQARSLFTITCSSPRILLVHASLKWEEKCKSLLCSSPNSSLSLASSSL